MPNSASGQKYASGFDVTDPLWSQLEYQLSTVHYKILPHTKTTDIQELKLVVE